MKKKIKLILLGSILFQITHELAYGQSELEKALSEGKPTLNARLRYETAEVGSLEDAEALTVRTRLGYKTGGFYGFKSFVELEDTTALNDDTNYSVPAPADQKVPGTSIKPIPKELRLTGFGLVMILKIIHLLS